MTGFSADWLSLREPADERARTREIRDAAVRSVAGKAAPRIVDLACGTGSTLRALAPCIATAQRWRLVDNDPALLERVRSECGGRAGIAELETIAADLADDPRAVIADADLVTTSAFLDLVSEDWAARLVATLANRGLPFYAALSYDGRVSCEPAHPLDDRITERVNRHQRGDKGFGPALGPDAAQKIVELLERADFSVMQARSDWTCRTSEPIFQGELIGGWAQAAEETGGISADDLADWKAFRLAAVAAGRSCIRVGHVDVFARPQADVPTAVHGSV